MQGLLAAELALNDNWTAQLPVDVDAMVTLAADAGDLATRAHPLGRFLFSQRVVPLGLALERFGATGVAGANRFDLGTVTIGGIPVTDAEPVHEHFARAQFVQMSEDARLASPSFEAMQAGVAFSAETFNVGAGGLAADLDYETPYLDLGPRHVNQVRRSRWRRSSGTPSPVTWISTARPAARQSGPTSATAPARGPRCRVPGPLVAAVTAVSAAALQARGAGTDARGDRRAALAGSSGCAIGRGVRVGAGQRWSARVSLPVVDPARGLAQRSARTTPVARCRHGPRSRSA